MALVPGSRVGNYELVAPLGAGGMGEVYRARDTRLDRVVAIKSLPEAFAKDPERVARFEREARLLASLDHPNIAGIHGIEDLGGASYLVLEFVEGETLSQRLARGPLSVRETLDVGIQVAGALEAAHERGVVHRDLKPGNVMLTGSSAKVLDFGLAKHDGEAFGSSPNLSVTPTVAMATADGIILGTAPYMSPEQARGKAVDRRADVWALGCVLYECLTARQAFPGETSSDVIARILEREPEWNALPASLPPRLREIVRRCLTKDPGERPRDVGDLKRELASIMTELSTPSGISASTATPSLAVLYFENLSSDKDSDYFCAGITEDILTDLSKIKGLRVASRNAVARYRGTSPDLAKVGQELNVRAVVEGSVRRVGDRVRISAQLVNAADGFHLWAERYDRTLEDVFAVQEEIASSIAAALRVALTPKETEALGQDRPQDVRAYDLYLKGRELYSHYTHDSLRRALELFQKAIEIDPGYARAYAGIADCHGQLLQWSGADDREEALRLGLEAARKGIALNPKLPEAYKAEALVLRFSGDRAAVRAALIRALDADPRFTPALINLAVDEVTRGNLASAERLARRAIEIDPQDPFPMTWLAYLLFATGRTAEARDVNERMRRLATHKFQITAYHSHLIWFEASGNDWKAVEGRLSAAAADGADPHNHRALESMLLAWTGRSAEALRAIEEVEHVPTLLTGTLHAAAAAAVRLGEHDRAVTFFQREAVRDFSPVLIRLTPQLHPLLDRPPFAPRRLDASLVWPLESPMIDAARFRLFREVKIDTGLPEASEIRVSRVG